MKKVVRIKLKCEECGRLIKMAPGEYRFRIARSITKLFYCSLNCKAAHEGRKREANSASQHFIRRRT